MFLHQRSNHAANGSHTTLAASFEEVRALTERLCVPLAVEDFGIQSMPDASPAKWHLAHTTWFFENFVLADFDAAYRPFHPQFGYLFNSYYNTVGAFWPRSQRGVLSRPTVAEVFHYRASVDASLLHLLGEAEHGRSAEIRARIVLGLNHEQQHQELLLTDLQHAFASNPLRPSYRELSPPPPATPTPLRWPRYSAGLRWIGHEGTDFAYDNETPRHQVFVAPFQLGSRLVTSGEYRAFLEDGGYAAFGVLAVRWLGDAVRRELAGATILGAARWCLVQHDIGRFAAGTGDGPSLSCELLRGRRLCALGRGTPAHGSGMGDGGARVSPAR